MIIVKTSNGDKFVNDKAALMVDHDKESKMVHVVNAIGEGDIPPIEHVEMVIYANDAQPTQWKDEGSVIEQLRATIERLHEEIDYTRSMMRSQRSLYTQTDRVLDVVKYQLRMKIESRSWSDIEIITEDVEKRIEEIKHEYDKTLDEYNEKRLKPCKG